MKISPEVMRERSTVVLWDTLRGLGSISFIELYSETCGMKKSDDAVGHSWDARERAAWLIKQGADVSTEHNERLPALAAVDLGNAEILRVLACAGAPLESSGHSKGACIRAAARINQLDMLQMVLDAGSNPDARPDRSFATALISACRGLSDEQALACVEALLKAGADIEACMEPMMITPLIAAARCGNVAVCCKLIQGGANVNAQLVNGSTAEDEARNAGYVHLPNSLPRGEKRACLVQK